MVASIFASQMGGGGAFPPIPPGPMDFRTNEKGLTELTVEFGLALPHAMVGLYFYYQGDPTFSVTHGGEPLTVRTAKIGGIGALLAYGNDLTVEVAPLVISCTGGTFGGADGRINEVDFPFEVIWEQLHADFGSNTSTIMMPQAALTYGAFGVDKETYGANGVTFGSSLPVVARGAIFEGDKNIWGGTPSGVRWTMADGDLIHTGVYSEIGNFSFGVFGTSYVFSYYLNRAVPGDTITASFRMKTDANNFTQVLQLNEGWNYIKVGFSPDQSFDYGVLTGVGDFTISDYEWFFDARVGSGAFGKGVTNAYRLTSSPLGQSYYAGVILQVAPRTEWTPANLGTKLKLWLDAEDAATITSSSGVVSSWANKAPQGGAFTQPTVGFRPSVDPTGFNGRPQLLFDGTDDYMTGASGSVGPIAGPLELWSLVDQRALGTDTTQRWAIRVGATSVTRAGIARSVQGGLVRFRGVVGDGTQENALIETGVEFLGAHLTRVQALPTQFRASLDALPDLTASINSQVTSGTNLLGSQNTTSSMWLGGVNTMIVTDPLTVEEATSLRAYLEQRTT